MFFAILFYLLLKFTVASVNKSCLRRNFVQALHGLSRNANLKTKSYREISPNDVYLANALKEFLASHF